MRVSLKILLVLLFVAVVPVAVSGITSVVLARAAVTQATNDTLEAEARHLSELAQDAIVGALDDLRQAATLNLGELTPAEISGALWVVYRADAARAAVALVDGDTGESVLPAVYQSTVGTEAGLVDHDAFPHSSIEAFAQHIPLAEALSAGKAIGVPYVDAARGTPLVVLAVRVPGPVDKAGHAKPWVVAAELSLRNLNARFAQCSDDGLTAYLLDLQSRAVCHSSRDAALVRTDLSADAGARALLDPQAAASATLPESGGQLAAYARAPRLASADGGTWGVVVKRDKALALAPVAALSQRTAFWVLTALVMALVAGLTLARGIARPLEVLTRIVQQFGRKDRGEGVRAPAFGNDEIGALGATFNRMADDIDAYTSQLHSFNTELKHKVDDRTRELKDAQGQLIQSQKMAAVGELGAGVAHEINNPLAAVLGSAQLALLRLDKPDARVRGHLQDIEREALRIRDIVESLLKLSQLQGAQAQGAVDVNGLVEAALALLARPIIAQRISVKKQLGRDLPKINGNAADLQQAVMQLLTNAKDAMPDGGTLTLTTESVDGKLVKIDVHDNGHGVPEHLYDRLYEPFFTTRASKGHRGMGLSIVHRIVEDHGGKVHFNSVVSKGTSFRLVFPAARQALHLS